MIRTDQAGTAGGWLSSNSVAMPGGLVYRAIAGAGTNEPFNVSNFAGSFVAHKAMMAATGADAPEAKLMYYMYVPEAAPTANSARSIKALSSEYYRKIERQLAHLSDNPDEDDSVEQGAIDTALAVVRQLEGHELAPPALSWHGGDAVVMLWALGDTTYAITVTDGELGYVVRRNRKSIRSVHSVQLKSFKLMDLR